MPARHRRGLGLDKVDLRVALHQHQRKKRRRAARGIQRELARAHHTGRRGGRPLRPVERGLEPLVDRYSCDCRGVCEVRELIILAQRLRNACCGVRKQGCRRREQRQVLVYLLVGSTRAGLSAASVLVGLFLKVI